MTELPHNGQYYTIKELVEAKGTSLPVRSALLTMESRILALEHDLAEERAKNDPLAEIIAQIGWGNGWDDETDYARQIRKALAARGLEIKEISK
jgi:hypothetical protein